MKAGVTGSGPGGLVKQFIVKQGLICQRAVFAEFNAVAGRALLDQRRFLGDIDQAVAKPAERCGQTAQNIWFANGRAFILEQPVFVDAGVAFIAIPQDRLGFTDRRGALARPERQRCGGEQ